MAVQTLPGDWYWDIELAWAPPVKVTSGMSRLPERCFEKYGLYRFERDHHLRSYSREIIRIGIAYDQTIGNRALRYESLVLDYRRRGSVWFSYAVLWLDGRHRRARYEEVEHLLVYVTQPLENEKKRQSLPNVYYRIENSGHRGALPRRITFPLVNVET
jgi:hypothetical protein